MQHFVLSANQMEVSFEPEHSVLSFNGMEVILKLDHFMLSAIMRHLRL